MNAHEDAQDANLTAPPAGVASVPTVDAAVVLAQHGPCSGAYDTGHGPYVAYAGGGPHTVRCVECSEVWQGDAETGGCAAVLLAKRVLALEHGLYDWQRVVQVEGWGATPRCRGCGASPVFTGAHPCAMPVHAAGCWVAALCAPRTGGGGGA